MNVQVRFLPELHRKLCRCICDNNVTHRLCEI
nr:MAG TPA: hypothetical protein [Crassvirales sp.]